MIFGYARVSTEGQDPLGQVLALEAAGAEKIYREKASGAKTTRKELARVLDALGDGDVLLVTRLDRLARSTRDLLNVVDAVGKKGAAFRSLADPWADTTTPHGKLMMTVLAGLAEFERSLIHARTSEGRARAKERGVKMGRPSKLTAFQRAEILKALEDGTATAADLARRYGLHKSNISRMGP